MKNSMKRLAKDQVALRRSLPPNYFFEDSEDGQSLPDDLTQLIICLTGPEGTPYSQGVWNIRLIIPVEYPQSPPTAAFKTRIFHPNVAEETGAVCLETLKRDWDPKLTLKDILITISCLLIQPNPDSALNQKAGALIQEDYAAFARQARLMTRIHAPIPVHLSELAQVAKRRGEEANDQAHTVATGSLQRDSKQNILRESQPVKIADEQRKTDEKPTKRPIADVTDTACIQQSDNLSSGRPRKSPKHQHQPGHIPEQAIEPSRDLQPPHKNMAQPDEEPLPQKIIFKAQWSMKSGQLRAKARIGIRRL